MFKKVSSVLPKIIFSVVIFAAFSLFLFGPTLVGAQPGDNLIQGDVATGTGTGVALAVTLLSNSPATGESFSVTMFLILGLLIALTAFAIPSLSLNDSDDSI